MYDSQDRKCDSGAFRWMYKRREPCALIYVRMWKWSIVHTVLCICSSWRASPVKSSFVEKKPRRVSWFQVFVWFGCRVGSGREILLSSFWEHWRSKGCAKISWTDSHHLDLTYCSRCRKAYGYQFNILTGSFVSKDPILLELILISESWFVTAKFKSWFQVTCWESLKYWACQQIRKLSRTRGNWRLLIRGNPKD